MEFIKENLKLIIIVAAILILLIIIFSIINKSKKKKRNALIPGATKNNQYKLEAKTVSIFEAINKEAAKQRGDKEIKYVNDFQTQNQKQEVKKEVTQTPKEPVVNTSAPQVSDNSSVLAPPTQNNTTHVNTTNPNEVLAPPTNIQPNNTNQALDIPNATELSETPKKVQ